MRASFLGAKGTAGGRVREKPDLKSPSRGFSSPEDPSPLAAGTPSPGPGVTRRGGRCRGCVRCRALVPRNTRGGRCVGLGGTEHASSFAYLCAYVYISICLYVYIYIFIYRYIYKHIHTHSASRNAGSGVVVRPRGLVCFLRLTHLYSCLFLDVPCAVT